jgi:uncharacterized membrane protein YfcA
MIFGFSLDTLAFLWVGAFVGGIAAGGSGFAFGLAASSIWLHRVDPLHSAILITGCGTLLHLTTIWQQRRHLEVPRLWPFIAGGVLGIPIGVHLLVYTDGAIMKICSASSCWSLELTRCCRRDCIRSRPGAVPPMLSSALSAAFLAALAAIPASCPPSGRNYAAGRRRRPAPSTSPM